MKTRVAYGLVAGSLCALVAACGALDFANREPWRDAEEARCLRQGGIVPASFAEPLPPIRHKYTCGLEHPFKVSGLGQGEVSIQPAARLGCPMNSALNKWLRDVVQPAAYSNFGQPVVGLKNIASYGCRTRNNKKGAKLSEHSFGNALDIKAFYLADGREVTLLQGWKGAPDQRAFLRQVHAGACGTFKTVLGPGSDGYHEDHFHLDLARHNAQGTAYCRPRVQQVQSAPQFQMQPSYPPQDPYAQYPQQDPYGSPQAPADQPVYPDQDPYSVNTPMSFTTEPRWPIARVPTPYAASTPDDALDH